ncbi:nicotianamine synthase [Haloactinopolyspora alba]|uniref:Nicotianamine synthase n=1 Tax=Haloactinopolyspora alba TaxID=648780 RepID=A0A2P8DWK8_9ACTN|nr:nicotianamine synthase family protein [Haloactinopolyspora alba]PSL01547.1 nicotianamine synthase [Haloactinopolyspora alba]
MNMSLTTKTLSNRPTSDIVAARRDTVRTELLSLHRELESLPDLRPGQVADDVFGRLVRLVLSVPHELAPAVLDDETVRAAGPRLRELCSRGESELERAWSERIATARSPRDELARFPYADNYRRLSRMEIGMLASAVGSRVRSLAFVGAGPLPLSALHLAGELDVAVDLVDHDPEALEAGARVAGALGFGGLGRVRADAADVDLGRYDVVVLAALVGGDAAGKARVLRRMAGSAKPGAVVLARSARGLRQVLYPAVDVDALDGYELLSVVHPVNDVINSAVLARVNTSEE